MTPIDSLYITVPFLLTLFGTIIAWQNYKLKKKESDKKDSQEDVDRVKQEDEYHKNVELQLLDIKKDLQYIRTSLDTSEKRYQDHENRIRTLETTCKKMKGGSR